ncbi:hypothetical protein [Nocardia spumae]|uniref:hypothetical protein n=1 Tax=Nocardia spumae TaxID=2887190 RepID=UPI001D1460EF|nr:hypothetical protein [Nocardia spumae]
MSELSTIQQLAAEVDGGNLRLKVRRDKLDEAIKGLQDLIDRIDTMGQNLKDVEYVTGFGGFQMGLDLATKFTTKGSGEDGIKQRATEVQKELKAAQELILKAARAYAETDSEYADVLSRTEV